MLGVQLNVLIIDFLIDSPSPFSPTPALLLTHVKS